MSRIYSQKKSRLFLEIIDHLFQWIQIQFSFNETLHFIYTGLLSPEGLWIKTLIVAGSNCNNYS